LTSYIETKSDVFGNIPHLEYDESNDEEDDDDEAEGEENSQPEDGAKEAAVDSEEPKIEEVPNKKQD